MIVQKEINGGIVDMYVLLLVDGNIGGCIACPTHSPIDNPTLIHSLTRSQYYSTLYQFSIQYA
jgi:hypothetical protein